MARNRAANNYTYSSSELGLFSKLTSFFPYSVSLLADIETE